MAGFPITVKGLYGSETLPPDATAAEISEALDRVTTDPGKGEE